VNQTTG